MEAVLFWFRVIAVLALDVLAGYNMMCNFTKYLGVEVIPVWDMHLSILIDSPRHHVPFFPLKDRLEDGAASDTSVLFQPHEVVCRYKEAYTHRRSPAVDRAAILPMFTQMYLCNVKGEPPAALLYKRVRIVGLRADSKDALVFSILA